jgi:hypothetical protein
MLLTWEMNGLLHVRVKELQWLAFEGGGWTWGRKRRWKKIIFWTAGRTRWVPNTHFKKVETEPNSAMYFKQIQRCWLNKKLNNLKRHKIYFTPQMQYVCSVSMLTLLISVIWTWRRVRLQHARHWILELNRTLKQQQITTPVAEPL